MIYKYKRVFSVGDSVKTKDGKTFTVTSLIENKEDLFPKVAITNGLVYEEFCLRLAQPHGIKQTRDNAYLDFLEAKAKSFEAEQALQKWDQLAASISFLEKKTLKN